jgi:hypothetical protein
MTLLILSIQCFAGTAELAVPQSAKTTVVAFYKWYLHALAADKEPLEDDRAELARYVSLPLLREIDRRIHSDEGMDADYFIQAQDVLPDWLCCTNKLRA